MKIDFTKTYELVEFIETFDKCSVCDNLCTTNNLSRDEIHEYIMCKKCGIILIMNRKTGFIFCSIKCGSKPGVIISKDFIANVNDKPFKQYFSLDAIDLKEVIECPEYRKFLVLV